MLKTIHLNTPKGENLVEITTEVRGAVEEAGVKEGICVLFIPHTTASVTVNSRMDPKTLTDVVAEVRRLVPTRVDFEHVYDTPADAAGHIKATLLGSSQTFIVSGGELVLGTSQGIFFYEFDGPRPRQVLVRVLADE